ncbi:SCP2 sterol-binding domain-containing protein [Myxococcota bacterium]
MPSVPDLPSEFFQGYLPARVASLLESGNIAASMVGSITFRVLETSEEYSLRVEHGQPVCSLGMAEDVLLQVSFRWSDFQGLFLGAAEGGPAVWSQSQGATLALGMLRVDAERASLVRRVGGSIGWELRQGARIHRLVLTPGSAIPELEQPTCRITLEYRDFLDVQAGRVVPLQLLMAGKILIEGNAQGLMTLVGLFG